MLLESIVLSRPWPVFQTRHGGEIMCVSGRRTRESSRESSRNHSARDQNARNPGIPDGFGQFSMVWGKFLINLKPAASRISRVMVPKYFLVVSKFIVASRKCCRMQVGKNNLSRVGCPTLNQMTRFSKRYSTCTVLNSVTSDLGIS